jgi:hypothetical protein
MEPLKLKVGAGAASSSCAMATKPVISAKVVKKVFLIKFIIIVFN